MDLSQLHGALASKSYGNIADICDELMLKVASLGVPFQEEWPYAIHLLGHIYVGDMNSAKFLWKSIPSGVKESQPEVVAVWKILECLWKRDYAGVYAAFRGFDWSPEVLGLIRAFSGNIKSAGFIGFPENYTKRMFQLLLSAYSTISVADTAHFIGMSEEDATKYTLQHGWTLDVASQMLTVKRQPVVAEQKVDPANLQRLTEYVFHLEH